MKEPIPIAIEKIFFTNLTPFNPDVDIPILAADIKRNGLKHPIDVINASNGMYEGLDGNRRTKASILNGETTILGYVLDIKEADKLDYILSANKYRCKTIIDLYEEGIALAKSIDRQGKTDENKGKRKWDLAAEKTGYYSGDNLYKYSVIKEADSQFPNENILSELAEKRLSINSAYILSQKLRENTEEWNNRQYQLNTGQGIINNTPPADSTTISTITTVESKPFVTPTVEITDYRVSFDLGKELINNTLAPVTKSTSLPTVTPKAEIKNDKTYVGTGKDVIDNTPATVTEPTTQPADNTTMKIANDKIPIRHTAFVEIIKTYEIEDKAKIYCQSIHRNETVVANAFDLLVTSPEYANMRTYKDNTDEFGVNETDDEYLNNQKRVFSKCFSLLKPTGVCVINIDFPYKRGKANDLAERFVLMMLSIGYKKYLTIIWNKNNGPIRGKLDLRPLHTWEYVFVFIKDEDAFYENCQFTNIEWHSKNPPKVTKSTSRQNPDGTKTKPKTYATKGNDRLHDFIWEDVFWDKLIAQSATADANRIKKFFSPDGTGHPAMFPTSLPLYAIMYFSKPGQIVCDPYLGSGTSGVASILSNRSFIGFDVNDDYCQIAEKRIKGAIESFEPNMAQKLEKEFFENFTIAA